MTVAVLSMCYCFVKEIHAAEALKWEKGEYVATLLTTEEIGG